MRMSPSYALSRTAACARRWPTARPSAWPTRASSPATRRPAAPSAVLLVQQRPARRDPDRPRPSDRRTIRPASPTSSWNRRSPPSWICEDSVAAVDAEDKVAVYRNWLGLMQGRRWPRLSRRAARRSQRRHPGPRLHAPDGERVHPARPQPAADAQCRPPHDHRRACSIDGAEAPEGLLDAVITSLIALHDLQGRGRYPQQPRRLGLYRQAEDARAGGGGLRLRAVRPRSRTCSGCRATR